MRVQMGGAPFRLCLRGAVSGLCPVRNPAHRRVAWPLLPSLPPFALSALAVSSSRSTARAPTPLRAGKASPGAVGPVLTVHEPAVSYRAARQPAAAAPVDEQALAAAGLRAFERIAQAWGLSVDEQLRLLGQPPRSTFFAWRRQPEKASLARDTLERLSYLLGIWKSLQILLPDSAAADAWVRQPNAAAAFGGASALDRMLAGNVSDLHRVRSYLDSVRGGGWA